LLGGEREKSMSLNLKNAVVVRLGEKRILHGLLRGLTARLETSHAPSLSSGENRKRKADGTGAGGRRAAKR
jgi:hypothetical protein